MYQKSIRNVKATFNWKKWLYILIGLIVIFPIIRFIIRQYQKFNSLQVELDEKNTEVVKGKTFLENQNPVVAQNKADKITVRKDVQSAAKQLAHDLGTKYSDKNSWWDWLDPRGWTENDKKVADTLLYQRYNYTLLKRLYNEVYTNSRNLTDDLFALLDKNELKRVQAKLKLI
jgi:hypothetical protein